MHTAYLPKEAVHVFPAALAVGKYIHVCMSGFSPGIYSSVAHAKHGHVY